MSGSLKLHERVIYREILIILVFIVSRNIEQKNPSEFFLRFDELICRYSYSRIASWCFFIFF